MSRKTVEWRRRLEQTRVWDNVWLPNGRKVWMRVGPVFPDVIKPQNATGKKSGHTCCKAIKQEKWEKISQ